MAGSVDAAVQSIIDSIDRQREKGDTDPSTWRKLSTLVSSCGWKNRSDTRMRELSAALAAAGVYPSLDVSDMDLGLDTTVRLALRPWLELGAVFKTEPELGYHVSKYPQSIEKALPHLGKLTLLSGGRKSEKTYYFHGSAVKPDLVLRTDRGTIVVVELEKGDPKDESVNQLERYLVAAEERHNAPVAGILITARPRRVAQRRQVTRHLDQLRSLYPEVAWLWYDVAVTLSPAD